MMAAAAGPVRCWSRPLVSAAQKELPSASCSLWVADGVSISWRKPSTEADATPAPTTAPTAVTAPMIAKALLPNQDSPAQVLAADTAPNAVGAVPKRKPQSRRAMLQPTNVSFERPPKKSRLTPPCERARPIPMTRAISNSLPLSTTSVQPERPHFASTSGVSLPAALPRSWSIEVRGLFTR